MNPYFCSHICTCSATAMYVPCRSTYRCHHESATAVHLPSDFCSRAALVAYLWQTKT